MDSIIKKLLIIIIVCLAIQSGVVSAEGRKLDKVFVAEMLGKDLTHLEKLIGSAQITNEHISMKSYWVEGCHLAVGYDNTSITSLTLLITRSCSFNFEESEFTPVNQPTFGDFGGSFYADCLYMCGNRGSLIRRIKTVHPSRHKKLGSYDIMVAGIMVNGTSVDKANSWAKAMIKKEGESWVKNNKFNCNPKKYTNLAGTLLEDEPIETISMGYNLLENLKPQMGCQ